MAHSKNPKAVPSRKPSLVSHRAHCSVCSHPQCEEIEREYISWKSPAKIAGEFELRDRSAVYRHARALDLGPKRARNIRAALERMIEKADDVAMTASSAIQAIALYSKINARGEFLERDDQVGTHELFEEMDHDELAAYAKDGTLPSWVPPLKIGNGPQGTGGCEDA